MSADLVVQALAWAGSDPDPATRQEIERLVEAGPSGRAELAERFAGYLTFGTAGLRGLIGGGTHRMNRAMVRRTTWGLGTVLLRGNSTPSVVIGFDGRRMSREFADDAACVLAALGFHVHRFESVVPTPLLAFAVRELKCDGGIMITASHNPAQYNGYKAYGANGAQIVPPLDEEVENLLEGAPPVNRLPFLRLEEAQAKGLLHAQGEALHAAYLSRIASLGVRDDGQRSLSIVYTPLHGVGFGLASQALAQARFHNVATVPEQRDPDAAFPTVAYPNPEEKGALDLALHLARERNADLVLANDPDADRLAVAVVRGERYQQLTGNQTGTLLGHYLLTDGLRRDKVDTARGMPAVIASLVSSPMLGVIAESMGAHYEETLTGFKWIAGRAMELEAKGFRFLFGYEEALGFTIGSAVRDKDGISAAVLFAELTAVLRQSGKTVIGHLETLYRRYGLYSSMQVSITREGAAGTAEIQQMMQNLRERPPATIGSAHDRVVAVRDYKRGVRVGLPGASTPLTLPTSDVLAFELASGSRVIARPSGTEPKAKFYVDVRENVAMSESLQEAEKRANARQADLANALVALVALAALAAPFAAPVGR